MTIRLYIVFTLKLELVLIALDGLLSDADSEHSRLSTKGLTSDPLELDWLLAADWAVGLCPVLSSKVIERTARLVGSGLVKGDGRREDECK